MNQHSSAVDELQRLIHLRHQNGINKAQVSVTSDHIAYQDESVNRQFSLADDDPDLYWHRRQRIAEYLVDAGHSVTVEFQTRPDIIEVATLDILQPNGSMHAKITPDNRYHVHLRPCERHIQPFIRATDGASLETGFQTNPYYHFANSANPYEPVHTQRLQVVAFALERPDRRPQPGDVSIVHNTADELLVELVRSINESGDAVAWLPHGFARRFGPDADLGELPPHIPYGSTATTEGTLDDNYVVLPPNAPMPAFHYYHHRMLTAAWQRVQHDDLTIVYPEEPHGEYPSISAHTVAITNPDGSIRLLPISQEQPEPPLPNAPRTHLQVPDISVTFRIDHPDGSHQHYDVSVPLIVHGTKEEHLIFIAQDADPAFVTPLLVDHLARVQPPELHQIPSAVIAYQAATIAGQNTQRAAANLASTLNDALQHIRSHDGPDSSIDDGGTGIHIPTP